MRLIHETHQTTRRSAAIMFVALADAVLIDALVQYCSEFDLNLLKLGGSCDGKGLASINVASLVCTIEAALHNRVRNEDNELLASVDGNPCIIEDTLKWSEVALVSGNQGIPVAKRAIISPLKLGSTVALGGLQANSSVLDGSHF